MASTWRGTRRSASDEEIIRQIYVSMLERSRWASLFPLLTKSFETTYSVVLVRTHVGSSQVTETDFLVPERQHAYESYYCNLRPPTCFDASGLAVGRVFTDSCYPDHSAYLRSELCNDFFRPLHAEHMAFLCAENSPMQQTGLVLRKSHLAGPFNDCHVRRLRRLAAHLGNREFILSRMDTASFERASFRQVFEQIRLCAFIVDAMCRILHATTEGELLLQHGKLMVVQGGELCVGDACMQAQFRVAVRTCAESLDLPEMPVCRTLRVKSSDGPGVTTISVSATTWTNSSGMSGAAALVLIGARPQKADEVSNWLAHAHGLTPAESRAATALCFGRQPNDYARDAGLSVETVRTLLKRAMEKTDTHSQAQLVSVVFRNVTRP